ncbi:DUF3618 domain-containing protein [Streptomyces zingiberis]|uniref:DUF3618 domain-containing protein n=1 Tax=Streptomyces zingiberis TaxID=2053010 RepID=A0ABX1C260_9ACTN|nr:DUF3618 domain-containing protein [Streptomyces zingiberis]NJQ02861.1 DUF3618 domain-containing protein [Streptomyces zingiberis]
MTSTPDELRAEVVQARERLGDTVAQLAARTDVKARAKARAEETKERVRSAPVPPPVLVVAGAAAVFLVALMVRGRRAEKGRIWA